jgi:hypothetical protein
MSRAVEVTGGMHEERLALHSGWIKALAICWAGGFSLSFGLNSVVHFRELVVEGEWALMLFMLGSASAAFVALAKFIGLPAVHVTRDGVEVRCYPSVRTASWDEIAQIERTEFVRRSWTSPFRSSVVIVRIRFVDGHTTTFIANLSVRDAWNSRAPRALTLRKRKCTTSTSFFTIWRSSSRSARDLRS